MASKSKEESIAGSATKRCGESSGDGEKRQKIGLTKPSCGKNFKGGIQIKLNPPKATQTTPLVRKNTSVFNDESDDEPVEMPPEARMRMRNIGRDTPTSAGPNSFGKTKYGFYKKPNDNDTTITEKDLKNSRTT